MAEKNTTSNLKTVAERFCVLGNQFTLSYELESLPEYHRPNIAFGEDGQAAGTDPRFDWGDTENRQAFIAWLEETDDGAGRSICSPRVTRVSVGDDSLTVEIERLVRPSFKDMDDYAAWCGCSSFEEAQCNYGDMPWASLRCSVKVAGSFESFARTLARHCW